jgi:hypothetical protein
MISVGELNRLTADIYADMDFHIGDLKMRPGAKIYDAVFVACERRARVGIAPAFDPDYYGALLDKFLVDSEWKHPAEVRDEREWLRIEVEFRVRRALVNAR